MSKPGVITVQTVAHIAQLASLPVNAQEQQAFAAAFSQTMQEVDRILSVDVSNIPPTHHSTGAKNVWRADVVDTDRLLSQEAVLSQAPHAVRGHIVVDRIIEES